MSGYLGTKAVLLSTTSATVGGDSTVGGDLTVDTNTLYVDSTNNRVGIGNAAPTQALDVTGDIVTSGGVYLGGTGSANKLDDYEEGTWTPTYTTDSTNFSSITYDTAVTGGKYVKVGGMVYASGTLYTDSITVGSASGTVRVGGLPFTIAANTGGTQNGYTPVVIGEGANFAGDVPSMGRGVPTTTVIDLFYKTASNGPTSGLQVADMGTGANNNLLRFTIVYVAS